MSKKKMRPGKFSAIVAPFSVLGIAVAIAIPVLSNGGFETTLNNVFGVGTLHVTNAEGSDSWDTDYVTKKYDTATAARIEAAKTAESVMDDGIVLLKNKNNALPIAKQSAVAPMGYGYRSPIYGGTGSGSVNTSADWVYTPQRALGEYFNVQKDVENITLTGAAVNEVLGAPGTKDAAASSFGGDNVLRDFTAASYESQAEKLNGTTGIIFISRGGGEGQDVKNDGYADGTAHKLTLSKEEKATIKLAKAHCSKVVIIVNSSNVVELGDLASDGGEYSADAILWVGGPGSVGFKSMAKVLCGEVNPSGRTADIYPSNLLNDPTNVNFGDYAYTNAKYGSRNSDAHFVEYEEGVYYGYRYYETAASESAISYGVTDSTTGIATTAGAVVYPFGFGLSYSTFTQEFEGLTESNGKLVAKVKVTNTGSTAGKEVVQLYFNAPYTQKDKDAKVEKPVKNLVAFAKTDVLQPGTSTEVEVSFRVEDMASYDYTHNNGDGTTGCYWLESGDYSVYLGKNSHDIWGDKTYHVGSDVYYTNANPRQSDKDGQSKWDDEGNPTNTPAKVEEDSASTFVAATNRFEQSNEFMNQSSKTLLSRNNWNGTQPTAPTDSDKTLPQKYLDDFNSFKVDGFDYKTNSLLGDVEGSKVYNNTPSTPDNSPLTLNSFRGKSYFDTTWNDLMNKIDFNNGAQLDQLRNLFYYGAYNTAVVEAIGKVATLDYDGPQGFSSFFASGDWCAYPSEVVVASTYNQDLVEDYGHAIGQEGLSSGISGWYGPAMNTHRSPFAGRNFEYYSEDPVLAGKIAARVVSGAADEGIYAYIKHFALNDQETNRTNYICTWATEQTMREVYLKPFEIVVKEAKNHLYYTSDAKGTKSHKVIRGASAVMTAFNCIGTTMASCDYNLLTNVLRNEWGFQGMVETDFGPTVNLDAMVRSGNDFMLNASWGGDATPFATAFPGVANSNTGKNAMKKALKNICYTVVNSSAYNKQAPGATFYYDMAVWKILFYTLSAVVGVAAVAGLGFIGYRWFDFSKHPDKYQDPKKKEEKAE